MLTRYAPGWQGDLPDLRDYSPQKDEIAGLFRSPKVRDPLKSPPKAPIKKGDLTSCARTAR